MFEAFSPHLLIVTKVEVHKGVLRVRANYRRLNNQKGGSPSNFITGSLGINFVVFKSVWVQRWPIINGWVSISVIPRLCIVFFRLCFARRVTYFALDCCCFSLKLEPNISITFAIVADNHIASIIFYEVYPISCEEKTPDLF